MHRFEAAQHLTRPDGRQCTGNPGGGLIPITNNAQGCSRGGFEAMYSYPPAFNSYPPGSNPRLVGHLLASHSLPGNSMEGSKPSFPLPPNSNRINALHYHQGMSRMETGYLAQKRSGPMMVQYGGRGVVASSSSSLRGGVMDFSGDGYGTAGPRYHPYSHQHHQPPPPAQPQQQQKAGFLEQLLKNRGSHQSGYPPFYARSASLGMSNWPGQTSVANHDGSLRGFSDTAYGGRPGIYFPTPHNQQQHHHNGGRGKNGWGGYQSHYNHPTRPQSQSCHNYHHSFTKTPFHPSRFHQSPALPIIKNGPEEGVHPAEEQTDTEIMQSETRYKKNHQRMNAILNETMANCEPIQVSMSRIDSLRCHVRCLKDDVNKHKDDSTVVKDHCAKRLQDFKDSTAKFHADYRKLCQPIAEEEYNALVDKYYNELKEKLRQTQNNGNTCTDHDGYGVVGEETTEMLGANHVVFAKKDDKSELGDDANNSSNNNPSVLPPRHIDDYFGDGLFVEIPPANESPQQQMYQNDFPTPHQQQQHRMGHGMSSTCGAVEGDLYQEQRQMVDGKYYPTAGGGGMANHNNLLISAQPPHGGSRWQHPHQLPNNSSANNFGHPQGYAHTRGATMRQQQPQNNQQVRPSEELREFLLGLVQGKFRNDQQMNQHEAPQLQQEADSLPISQQQDHSQSEEGQEQLQHRRLMSGGGIVEVKHSPPHPSQNNQPTFYDDAATRDWINSLATSATPERKNDDADAAGDASQEGEEVEDGYGEDSQNEDHNNNMEHGNLVAEETSSVNNTETDGEGVLVGCSAAASAKNSRIAELLGSPCLNETNSEEFESELKQLEDALNGNSGSVKQDGGEEKGDEMIDEQLH